MHGMYLNKTPNKKYFPQVLFHYIKNYVNSKNVGTNTKTYRQQL